jgi:type IV pilus assembly protein PilB
MSQGQTDNRKLSKGAEEVFQQQKERDTQANAKALGMPYTNLMTIPINPDLADALPKGDAIEAKAALYFQVGKRIRLAVLDPSNEKTQALIARFRAAGYTLEVSLCSEESLRAGHKIYYTEIYQKQEELKNVVVEEDLGTYMKEIESLKDLKAKIEAANFDKALNYIQIGAYKTHSSDIHFEPEEKRVMVRFRIDGVLQTVFDITPKAYAGVLTEVKYLSHLKLNIVKMPQDGQYSFLVNDRQINVRVSTLPTHYGEATVMRLLDSDQVNVSFEDLGFEGTSLERIMQATRLSHGMVLVTGPTGSGKTTTLYSMLRCIDTKTKKVITLEDPIEYNLPGISQSQVEEEKGYTFATGLRSILRQDPDVIMVGEIRDVETAETAVQASLTGHLVFSTLHTNSAIESIPRLLNMGVRSFVLAPALNLIVAQRLVRKLCPACAFSSPITEAEKSTIAETLDSLQKRGIVVPAMPTELRHPKGCPVCSDTGFKDQLAIAEVLLFDQTLRDLILANAPMPQVYDHIEKNLKMTSVREDGVLKVVRGLTTLEEVDRVAR